MKKIDLITLQGNTPIFRKTEDSNFKSVNQRTFSDSMRDFQPVQSFKFAWDKAAEYLQTIAEKKDFKKLKQTILKVAAKDLDFNSEPQNTPEQSLTQKIKTAYKNSQMKPKFK